MEKRIKAIELKNLSYSYASDWTTRKFLALKDVNLDVYEGESFGFLGHNGAGKTTTIKCILNLIQPSQGNIHIFGVSSNKPNSRTSVGYLPEQPYFYDHLTVYELIIMYAVLAGVDNSHLHAAVTNSLDRVRVSAKSKSPMRSLSKGLTQRVAMAQAIVAKPKVLLLDEPFSGLDPIGRKEFKDLMFDLKESGTTMLISSHILGDIEHLCDRASIMAHGEIKEVFVIKDLPSLSSPSFELNISNVSELKDQLVARADAHEEYGEMLNLTFSDEATAIEMLNKAIEAKLNINSYRKTEASLEDLFVKLVKFDESKVSLKGS